MADDTPAADVRQGMLWVLLDMALVSSMTVLVKKGGADFPAVQMVFFRSLVGLVAVLPLVWRNWAAIRQTRNAKRNVLRVTCNAVALSSNWGALTILPLATANAIGFLRPLVVMVMAIFLLGERVTGWRWCGAALGLLGVGVMLLPRLTGFGEEDLGLGYLFAGGAILFGAMATIQTRALKGENTTVMMVFYTLGLTLFTAIPAMLVWQPVSIGQLPLLLGIGIIAQVAQYCYLRGYQLAPATRLAPLGYLSLIFATIMGYTFFDEIPTLYTLGGALVIILGLVVARRHA
ncbi:DMT family transporter [Ketogulonicigenium robustum]|nr:DMT family transporter [Ketogulonicigenium robustum]